MYLNVDHPVNIIGELEAKVDLAVGVCVAISADSEVDLNATITDRTFAINTLEVLAGQKARLICGAGTIFSTDNLEIGTPPVAGDILVCHTDGLLKQIVTPGTDFEVAECISYTGGILTAKLLV